MEHITKYFKKAAADQLTDNFIHSIGSDWMLLTAGTEHKFNPMTASWGAMGVLWNKPVAICFIRPSRYTFELLEPHEIFTLTFFPEKYREVLKQCGAVSGRNHDKIQATGITPLLTHKNGIGYQQGRLCLECRKIYYDELNAQHFLLPDTDAKFYSDKIYHYLIIGEITDTYLPL